MSTGIVIADTSVLVNFLRIDRMDLIGGHPATFIATEHVGAEISDDYPDQQARYQAALDARIVTEERIDDPTELDIFLGPGRHPRLGSGERSAIAVALNRGHVLAIDDNRAIKKALHEAGLTKTNLPIIRTQDIVVALIQAEALDVKAADAILQDWAGNHRFKLKISSFQQLL